MKKIIAICLLVFFTITGNAQINNNTNIKDLTRDQLNLALQYSSKTTKTGKALTVIGTGTVFIGTALIIHGANSAWLSNCLRTSADAQLSWFLHSYPDHFIVT